MLLVIGYHAFPGLLPGGLIGVDVFFVISGFLITGIIAGSLERGVFSFTDFYRRRIRRIFPALIVVLAACSAVGWFVLLPEEFRQLGKHIAAGAGFLSNVVLWAESGYFDNAADTKPLLHLWSLGVEEQFYIVWPAMLAAVAAWRRRYGLIATVAVLLVASFALNIVYVQHDPVFAFYSPFTRFWELSAGALLALLNLQSDGVAGGATRRAHGALGERGRDGLSAIGLILVGVPAVALTDLTTFPGWWALAPVIGTVLLLAAGADGNVNRKVLSHPGLVWVGLISYPLYLWHWPLLSFANILESGIPSVGLRLGMVACTFVLAWATYRWVEKPIRFGADPTRKAYASTGALLLMGCIGMLIVVNGGFAGRSAPVAHAPADRQPIDLYLERLSGDPQYVERLDDARTAAVRSPYCHFDDATFDTNVGGIAQCLRMAADRPNILVIGDSHAADVYAALALTYGEANILQATGAGCTPAGGLRITRQCHALLGLALAFARTHTLDAVVLSARWPDAYYWVGSEIATLRSFGQKVYLVGPPLEFTADVPKIILRRPASEPFERYMSGYVKAAPKELDRQMAEFARANGAGFISYIDLVCADGGCPVLNPAGELLILDNSHLTVPGAVHLGEMLQRRRVLEKAIAR